MKDKKEFIGMRIRKNFQNKNVGLEEFTRMEDKK
jgi:hypothetical protein